MVPSGDWKRGRVARSPQGLEDLTARARSCGPCHRSAARPAWTLHREQNQGVSTKGVQQQQQEEEEEEEEEASPLTFLALVERPVFAKDEVPPWTKRGDMAPGGGTSTFGTSRRASSGGAQPSVPNLTVERVVSSNLPLRSSR